MRGAKWVILDKGFISFRAGQLCFARQTLLLPLAGSTFPGKSARNPFTLVEMLPLANHYPGFDVILFYLTRRNREKNTVHRKDDYLLLPISFFLLLKCGSP